MNGVGQLIIGLLVFANVVYFVLWLTLQIFNTDVKKLGIRKIPVLDKLFERLDSTSLYSTPLPSENEKQSKTQAGLEMQIQKRNVGLTLTLILIVAIASGLTVLFMAFGTTLESWMGTELFKLNYQFLVLTVLGGAVALFYTEYASARRLEEKIQEERREGIREQRTKLLEQERQDFFRHEDLQREKRARRLQMLEQLLAKLNSTYDSISSAQLQLVAHAKGGDLLLDDYLRCIRILENAYLSIDTMSLTVGRYLYVYPDIRQHLTKAYSALDRGPIEHYQHYSNRVGINGESVEIISVDITVTQNIGWSLNELTTAIKQVQEHMKHETGMTE